MTETQECLHCKKTTRRKNNFCCGDCQKQYNKLHKTNIDYNDWDYIEAKIPGSKFVFKSGSIVHMVVMVLMVTQKNLVDYKLIPVWVAVISGCIVVAYLITYLIRYLKL
jgi:hypothetical protein